MILITDQRKFNIIAINERRKIEDLKIEKAFLKLHLKTALLGLVISWVFFLSEVTK